MYKQILVPLDGTKNALDALAHAIDLAKSQGSNLVLLNVIEDYSEQVGESYFDLDELQKEQTTLSQAILQEGAKAAMASGLKPELRSAILKPYNERIVDIILDEAKNLKADLIVMSSHGRHGLERILIGSVAEGVIRATRLPVLLIPAKSEG